MTCARWLRSRAWTLNGYEIQPYHAVRLGVEWGGGFAVWAATQHPVGGLGAGKREVSDGGRVKPLQSGGAPQSAAAEPAAGGERQARGEARTVTRSGAGRRRRPAPAKRICPSSSAANTPSMMQQGKCTGR